MAINVAQTIDLVDPKTLGELRELVNYTAGWPEDASISINVETGDPRDPRERGYRKTTLRLNRKTEVAPK